MILADEIFSSLKGFGFVVEMYGKDGKGPMASAELAAYIYAKDNSSKSSVMIRLPTDENSEYKKVVIYKSNTMDEKLKKLIMTIKKIALRYGNTVTIREFGRNIEPKDLAYIPQGERELANDSMNENAENKDFKMVSNKEVQDINSTDNDVGTIVCIIHGRKTEYEGTRKEFLKLQKHQARDKKYKFIPNEIKEDVVPFKNKNMKWWTGNYGNELEISLDDAKSASQGGKDAQEDIDSLRKKSYIEQQLQNLNSEKLKKELSEYGAWDAKELSNHEANIDRILWIACNAISEEAFMSMSEDAENFNDDITGPNETSESTGQNKNVEDEVRYMNTAYETPQYTLANVRHGLVLQNKETKKSVFFQGEDADHMRTEVRKALNYIDTHDMDQESGDEVLNRVFDAYETIMESVLPNKPKESKFEFGDTVDLTPEMVKKGFQPTAKIVDVNSDIEKAGLYTVMFDDGRKLKVHSSQIIQKETSDESPLGGKMDWQDSDKINEAAKYHRYGTTRSSYHVLPEAKKAKVIIRHSKKLIDEESVGARSRNVKNLYVESINGERRLIETKSLMAARAIANYVNRGGKLFDDVSNKIITLSEDIKAVRKLKKKYPVSEDSSNKKIHENLNSIYESSINLMNSLNTSKIDTLTEMMNLNFASVKFSESFYQERLGEEYKEFIESIARVSVIHSRYRKF